VELAGAAGREDAAGARRDAAVDVLREQLVVDAPVGAERRDGEEQDAGEVHVGLLSVVDGFWVAKPVAMTAPERRLLRPGRGRALRRVRCASRAADASPAGARPWRWRTRASCRSARRRH